MLCTTKVNREGQQNDAKGSADPGINYESAQTISPRRVLENNHLRIDDFLKTKEREQSARNKEHREPIKSKNEPI
jgi:hypothetical protein